MPLIPHLLSRVWFLLFPSMAIISVCDNAYLRGRRRRRAGGGVGGDTRSLSLHATNTRNHFGNARALMAGAAAWRKPTPAEPVRACTHIHTRTLFLLISPSSSYTPFTPPASRYWLSASCSGNGVGGGKGGREPTH